MARVAAAVLVLLVYGMWQMFRWGGRADQAFIGDLAFIPVNGAAVVLAWRVSRRADLGYRTRRAWRLLSLAMFLYLLGDLLQFWIENVMHRVAYPTWSDAAYLGFYVVAFCGLVSFPARRGSGPERLRLLLDLGGGVHRRRGAHLVPGARAGRRDGSCTSTCSTSSPTRTRSATCCCCSES